MGQQRGQWLTTTSSAPGPLASSLLLSAVLALSGNLVVVLARPAVTTETRPLAADVACPAVCQCSAAVIRTEEERSTPSQPTVNPTVLCTHGHLHTVPSPLPYSMAVLDLNHNRIGDLGNLSVFGGLERLDLSRNDLTVLRNGSMDGLHKLRDANFSFNAIDTIENAALWGLSELNTLILAGNRLRSLDEEVFSGLSNLQALNLSENAISEIGNRTFHHLICLEILDFSHNALTFLPIDAFHGLQSLRWLMLEHNQLVEVRGVLTPLLSLHLLDLSHNALTLLLQDQHQPCSALPPALHTLRLSFNNITRLSPAFFCAPSSVQEMFLPGNNIRRLESQTFQRFPHLRELDLSRMPYLRSVAHDALQGAVSLAALNLSHNPQLSFLHPQLLAWQPTLRALDLRYNALSVLSPVTFHANPNLAQVYLSHNPWRCGCSLAWLSDPDPDLSLSPAVTDLQQVTCRLPSNDTLIPIGRVPRESRQCNNVTILNSTTTTDVIFAKIGSQLVLWCDYDTLGGDDDEGEMAVLTWTTPRGLVFHYHPFHPASTAHLVDDGQNLSSPFHIGHPWHWGGAYDADLRSDPDHVVLQADGSLLVDFVLRSDGGRYRCVAHNAHSNASRVFTVHLDYEILFQVKITSLVVGMACAGSFFCLNAVYSVILWAARRLVNQRRRQRIQTLLVSLDDYRATHIARIRGNYSLQLGRIREHYQAQSLRLRDNYTQQTMRVRQGCSNQLDRLRDNYHLRLSHLKDYSATQITQIRDATNTQIGRIRDYGSLQMERLRESCKLQQQHVLKVLEAMNLENCRSVVETECMRTQSMIFNVSLPDLSDVDNTSNEEEEDIYSEGNSVYATALNSDNSSTSSRDSLNTPPEDQGNINSALTVENLTFEPLNVDNLTVENLTFEPLNVDSLTVENLTFEPLNVNSLTFQHLTSDSLTIEVEPVTAGGLLSPQSLPCGSATIPDSPVISGPASSFHAVSSSHLSPPPLSVSRCAESEGDKKVTSATENVSEPNTTTVLNLHHTVGQEIDSKSEASQETGL